MLVKKHIPYSRQWIDEEDIEAVNRVLRGNFITQGDKIEEFESKLCQETGTKHAVCVTSGTAALHLLCSAFSLNYTKLLDGVTSPITFASSANCMLHCNMNINFADVDETTGIMLPHTTPEADIGILVSFSGRVPQLDQLNRKFTCTVEDAAHSLGADYHIGAQTFNSGCCAHTNAAILSFHPVKHICTGEGGAALTNDSALAQELRMLRSHAIIRTEDGPDWHYDQIGLGFNYRLNDMQAALGISQLKRLPHFLQQRRALAKRYDDWMNQSFFKNHIRVAPYDEQSAYHLYIIHFKNQVIRDQAHTFLKERGVGTQVHYKPVYQHSYYRDLFGNAERPGADAFFDGCLSIPLYPKMNEEDQDYVVEQLGEFLEMLQSDG